jgi:hypothetical protein
MNLKVKDLKKLQKTFQIINYLIRSILNFIFNFSFFILKKLSSKIFK